MAHIEVEDLDANDTFTFDLRIRNKDEYSMFQVNSKAELVVVGSLSYNRRRIYVINVTATDSTGLSITNVRKVLTYFYIFY